MKKPCYAQTFAQRCYAQLNRIPAGKVTTYQEIARALGTTAYRAVGQAMRKNPDAPRVPCHRVVCSDGRIGGYAFGVDRKRQILSAEGVTIINDRVEDLDRFFFKLTG